MYPILKLKAEKESTILHRHPWIFSGALEKFPTDVPHGSLVHVADSTGKIIATGTLSSHTTIAVRAFDFGKMTIDGEWLRSKIKAAGELRNFLGYGEKTETTGYRLVFGESDMLPGLVVDRYNDVIVFQIATAGMDLMRDVILEILVELFHPRAIVERSDLSIRREEGLEEVTALRYGEIPGLADFTEFGWHFVADVMDGQKTGFYLDQKNLRRAVNSFADGKEVLNLFSYSGAFSVAAINGGARSVHNVDSSDSALALCRKNASLNGISEEKVTTADNDVFQWLSSGHDTLYDMVIIDPPALIKARGDFAAGRKAHHFLNRAAMRLVKEGGIFITSSCSTFFTENDLAVTLRRASVQNNMYLVILKIVHQSPDHTISLYFPESAYLKSLICRVHRK